MLFTPLSHYRLVLSNAQGCADTSEIEKVSFLYAGINALSKSNIYIYPNPNNGTFTIAGLKEDTDLEITDALNQSIHFTRHNHTLKLDGAPAGIYYLIIRGETIKLVLE